MTDSDTTSPHPALADVLQEVARGLDAENGVSDVLRAITASAVATIPGADYAGISLVKERAEVESIAATDDLVVAADRAQEESGDGPCLNAISEHQTVLVDDLEQEQRWPVYRRRALGLGIGSSLSFQLFTDTHNLGALNLYSKQPHAFDDEAQQIGLLFAAHAAIALRGAQQETELRAAISSRDTIGMAKGILIERFHVSADQAFAMLVRTSQRTQRKLHEVARSLVRASEAGTAD